MAQAVVCYHKSMNPEAMLKGRMVESLVEELLKASGNQVYRFGYESVIQNLAQIEGKFDGNCEVGEKIRAIPDFVVIDRKGVPSFVEVKFRWNAKFDYKSDYAAIERLHKYWNAKLVVVNCWEEPYFQVSDAPYVDERKNLVLRPLADEKAWGIKKETYAEFEKLVDKYLSPTLFSLKHKTFFLKS